MSYFGRLGPGRDRLRAGETWGAWTVLGPTENGKALCRCRCGAEKRVNVYNILNGMSYSCGCVKRDRAETLRQAELALAAIRALDNLPWGSTYTEADQDAFRGALAWLRRLRGRLEYDLARDDDRP